MSNQAQRIACLSYSRGADHDFKDKLREEGKKRGWEICYDEKELQPETSIEAFENKLTGCGGLIFLISPAYFKSKYCIPELIKAYEKRAKDLLPVVVFAKGASPGDIKPSEIFEYWKRSSEIKQAHRETLPAALAWLLGRYDKTRNNWDTFFLTVSADGREEEVAHAVLDALEQERKPRFSHCSAAERADYLSGEIARILKNPLLQDFPEDCYQPFMGGKPVELKQLKKALLGLVHWLDEVATSPKWSRDDRKRLAALIKKLTGLIILAAIDQVQLHRLVHELNREGETALLKLKKGFNSTYQIVVAAMCNQPALFRYVRDRNSAPIMGRGELVLPERGVDDENYLDTLASEAGWDQAYKGLAQQAARIEGAEDNYSKADSMDIKAVIDGWLEQIPAPYLFIDEKTYRAHSVEGFRRQLAQDFPTLPQLLATEQGDSKSYYLEPSLSGYIYQKLTSIYSKLEEIAHD